MKDAGALRQQVVVMTPDGRTVLASGKEGRFGLGPVVVRSGKQVEKDSGGFLRELPDHERYEQPAWWAADLLPAPLRHDSGHEGSHTFLTHEFVDALVKDRRPSVDVHVALACTAPGIVAHRSALQGGEQMKIPSFDPAS